MATITTSAFIRRVEGMLGGGYRLRWTFGGVNAEAQLLLLDLGICRSDDDNNDDKSIVPQSIRNNRFD